MFQALILGLLLGLNPAPADLNNDGVVDVSDMLILLSDWGPCPSRCSADLTGNGMVDVSDLLVLLGHWGPVSAVPVAGDAVSGSVSNVSQLSLPGVEFPADGRVVISAVVRSPDADARALVARVETSDVGEPVAHLFSETHHTLYVWKHDSPGGSGTVTIESEGTPHLITAVAVPVSGGFDIGQYTIMVDNTDQFNVPIVTQHAESLVIGAFTRPNNQPVTVTAANPDLDPLNVSIHADLPGSNAPQRLTVASFPALTAGHHVSTATYDNVASNLGILIEITNQEPFAAEAIESRHLDRVIDLVDATVPVNVLCVGDSLFVSSHGARLFNGLLRSWQRPVYSVAMGSGAPAGGMLFSSASGIGGVQYNFPARLDSFVVTDDFFGDGSFFGSLNFGRSNRYRVGNGFSPDSANRVRRFEVNRGSWFDTGIVADWVTDNEHLSMQVGYDWQPDANYVDGFALRSGTGAGDLYGSYAVDSADVICGPPAPGLNLLTDRVPIDVSDNTGYRVLLASDSSWEHPNETRNFIHPLLKLNDESQAATGMALACMAEATWWSQYFQPDLPPTQSAKQFTNDQLDRFIISVFDRDVQNFIVLCMGTEEHDLKTFITNLDALCNRFTAAFDRVGFTHAPKFLLLGVWRPGGETTNAQARTESEAMYELAEQRNDVAFLSYYGLEQGIYMDGTSPEQLAWAQTRGYDAIELQSGTFNAGTHHLNSDGIHPTDALAAMFRMLQVWDALNAARAEAE